MKLRLFTIAIATILLLMGCQGTDNMEGTKDKGNRDNVEQTRFNENNENRNMMDERNNRTNEMDRENRMNKGNDNNNKYDVSKKAADKITDEIAEIDQAYVLTTGNNAYVGAMLDNDQKNNQNKNKTGMNNKKDERNSSNIDDNGNDVTGEVKKKITDIVKSVEKDIDNVYVTTNPDFMDLTNGYMSDMDDGKPIKGFFDQMGNMIERVFPQNKR